MTPNTNTLARLTRRRLIAISAAAAGVALTPSLASSAVPIRTFSWQGVALGAQASLTLQHDDEAAAKAVIADCLTEVARLEHIFSLHRPDSALASLNREGRLDAAPADLRILLAEALALAKRTSGAFDPTIQPLWELYARHFSRAEAAPEGPSMSDIADILSRVGWQHVEITSTRVVLAKPGMALTLNGIAQGYITDRIGELLHSRGLTHVLVNMGEQLALGPKWDGTSWRVGIADPTAHERVMTEIKLPGGAVATSGGYRASFDGAGRHSQILDARTGRPAKIWSSISVVSPRAATADSLSTAVTLLSAAEAAALLANSGSRAFALDERATAGIWIEGT